MDLRRFRPYHLKLFLSNKYAYAQIAKKVGDDHAIVAAASTIEKGLQEGLGSLADKTACARYAPGAGGPAGVPAPVSCAFS